MFFCIDIGVDVDVDGNVAINVGKYLETNCWKWEASISRAQPPTVLSDFLHCCHWPESLLIKIEKFKRKRFTIIKLCLSLFVIVVIFVLTVFFTFAFYLILPQKWGLHIIMSSRQHWIIKVGALKITDPLYIGQSIVTRYLVLYSFTSFTWIYLKKKNTLGKLFLTSVKYLMWEVGRRSI